jgi:peptidase M48-like protein
MRGAFVSKAASLTVTAVLGLLGSNPIHAERRAPNPAAQVQLVVDELKGRLTIPSEVAVLVVANNPLLVSVEADKDRRGTFVMSFEEHFLAQLDPTELRAVIAHELGHVWIFTHHPYLQTERLANEVAMRVVSRQSLEKVYGKVWERGGAKGDLVQFLGATQ